MAKYRIGDVVWKAKYQMEQISIPCPICFGKKEVELILGNYESVRLPCNNCARGFQEPSGFVQEYEYTVEPEQIIISGVRTEDYGGIEKVEYFSGGCYVHPEESLYATEDEARTIGAELKVRAELEQEQRAAHIKYNNQKSFSWNAGYHLREAKRNRKEAERHERMAVLCKMRAKTPELQE